MGFLTLNKPHFVFFSFRNHIHFLTLCENFEKQKQRFPRKYKMRNKNPILKNIIPICDAERPNGNFIFFKIFVSSCKGDPLYPEKS